MAICDPVLCTGCAACANVCPVSCITMQPDAEGFLRPQVDESRCIHCHLCEKRCPVNNPASPRTPLAVYAAQAKDLSIRLANKIGMTVNQLVGNFQQAFNPNCRVPLLICRERDVLTACARQFCGRNFRPKIHPVYNCRASRITI